MFRFLMVYIVVLFIIWGVLGIVPVLLIGGAITLLATVLAGFYTRSYGFPSCPEHVKRANVGRWVGAILLGVIAAIGDGVQYSSVTAGLLSGTAGAVGGFILGPYGALTGGAYRDALRERNATRMAPHA